MIHPRGTSKGTSKKTTRCHFFANCQFKPNRQLGPLQGFSASQALLLPQTVLQELLHPFAAKLESCRTEFSSLTIHKLTRTRPGASFDRKDNLNQPGMRVCLRLLGLLLALAAAAHSASADQIMDSWTNCGG
jgi:hypothetical protein